MDRARVRERGCAPILDRSAASGRKTGPVAPVRSARNRRIAIAGLSAVIVLSLLLFSAPFISESKNAKAQSHTLRTPIVIDGDGDFTAANGVVGGAGSEADPYVISGWEIRVTTGSGMTVSNTISHFVISDVHVNATYTFVDQQYAVYMYNVSNGQVKDSLLNNTPYGVHVELSKNCSVHHNQIYSCNRKAVEMASCDRVNVVGNDILAANGVMASIITNSTVSLNTFSFTEMAVSLSDAADIVVRQNRMLSCGYAVMVSGGRGIVITGNNATDGFYGVYLFTCWDVNVSGNDISRSSASGISSSGEPTNVTFIYNRVRNSMYSGYMVDGADGVVVRENLFENNTVIFAYNGGGVTITSGKNMTFFHNDFVTNTGAQAQDMYGPENRWNETYPVGGNYWSDYAGPDSKSGPLQDQPGADGLGDVEYVIDADSIDNYPLWDPYYINSRPVALFTVTPYAGMPGQMLELNGSSSSDPDSGCGDGVREWRWDLDGDGNWDTDKSSENVTNHQYLTPGNYTAILEVTDSHGLTSLCQVQITISGTVIPEFGAVVLPVAGLLAVVGCAAVFSRREQGRA